MDKGIVERGKDVSDAKDELSLSDLGAKSDGLLGCSWGFSLGRHYSKMIRKTRWPGLSEILVSSCFLVSAEVALALSLVLLRDEKIKNLGGCDCCFLRELVLIFIFFPFIARDVVAVHDPTIVRVALRHMNRPRDAYTRSLGVDDRGRFRNGNTDASMGVPECVSESRFVQDLQPVVGRIFIIDKVVNTRICKGFDRHEVTLVHLDEHFFQLFTRISFIDGHVLHSHDPIMPYKHKVDDHFLAMCSFVIINADNAITS